MSIKLIQYFVHDATINGSRVGGSQTLTIAKNVDPSEAVPWGSPFVDRAKFKKKPRTTFSLQKILTDDYGPTFPGFDIRDLIPKRPVDKYDVGATIYGGGSIKLKDCVLTGISYSFRNQGFFTEDLTFEGTVTEATSAGSEGTGLTRNAEGVPYMRQHFTGGTLPSEVSNKNILGIQIDLSISYAELVTFGVFKTYENKFVSLPVQASVSFETLDRGYSQSEIDFSEYDINDEIVKQAILINTIPVSIDLGGANVLTSVDRSGANAGDSDYSTLTYNYMNVDNSFKLI